MAFVCFLSPQHTEWCDAAWAHCAFHKADMVKQRSMSAEYRRFCMRRQRAPQCAPEAQVVDQDVQVLQLILAIPCAAASNAISKV